MRSRPPGKPATYGNCAYCKKEFKVRKRGTVTPSRYCSKECYVKGRVYPTGEAHPLWINEFKDCENCGKNYKLIRQNKDRKQQYPSKYCSWICYTQGRKYPTSADHSNWKGDEAGYAAIHSWIKLRLGFPLICTQCGGTFGRREIGWANISGEYKRDLKDWVRLCNLCHRKYDSARYFKDFRDRYGKFDPYTNFRRGN